MLGALVFCEASISHLFFYKALILKQVEVVFSCLQQEVDT